MSEYKTYTDKQLLNLLKSGDETAMSEIYSRYHGVLYGHAYRRIQDREDARDIVQDLFTSIWDNRQSLQITTSFSSYLYTAVRNRILNIHRNQKVRDEFAVSMQKFIDEGCRTTEEEVREKELRMLIEKEVAALPPQMRMIFEMSRNLEKTHQEIADQLNLSPLTIRTQVRNALRILRIKLGTNILFTFFLISRYPLLIGWVSFMYTR